MKRSSLTTFLLLVLGVGHLYAAEMMSSCASISKLPEQSSSRLALVAVDQTTLPDDNLTKKFLNLATSLVKPETEIASFSFSAFSQGKYLSESFRATLEKQLDEQTRYEIPKKTLATFDRCLAQKEPAVKKQLSQQVQQDMSGASGQLAKSDVLLSLIELSKVMQSKSASDKVVLVFSDMLENSSVTSFYANASVKKIDVEKEIAIVEKAGMIGDFGGAKVYVMGAGLLSEQGKSKGVYRDPKTIQALKAFWFEWFKRSNAELVDFGTPEMLGEIR